MVDPAPRRHLPVLDGVRGAAILGVIFFHYTFESGAPPARLILDKVVLALCAGGWCGVDLFFVLSGFLITGILLDTRDEPAALGYFYVRRVLRIFPLYYVVLAIFFAIAAASHVPLSAANRISALVYLSNFTIGLHGFDAFPRPLVHFWSLAVEEQFYIVWPWLVFWLSRKGLFRLCVACLGTALAVRILLAYGLALPVAAYALMPARLDPLAAGALIALAARSKGGLLRWRKLLLALGGAGALGLLVIAAHTRTLIFTVPLVISLAPTCLAAIFSAALVLLLLAPDTSSVSRALSRGPLPFLGRYSYGLYVVHYPLFFGLRALGLSAQILKKPDGSVLPGIALQGGIAFAVSLVVALISWNLVEERFLKLKDRLAAHRAPLLAQSR